MLIISYRLVVSLLHKQPDIDSQLNEIVKIFSYRNAIECYNKYKDLLLHPFSDQKIFALI